MPILKGIVLASLYYSFASIPLSILNGNMLLAKTFVFPLLFIFIYFGKENVVNYLGIKSFVRFLISNYLYIMSIFFIFGISSDINGVYGRNEETNFFCVTLLLFSIFSLAFSAEEFEDVLFDKSKDNTHIGLFIALFFYLFFYFVELVMLNFSINQKMLLVPSLYFVFGAIKLVIKVNARARK